MLEKNPQRSRWLLGGLLSIGLMLGSRTAYCAAGSLDLGFGSGGKVVSRFATSAAPFESPIAEDVALQPDGKIVVALVLDKSSIATEAFGVARYLSNGSLDATFGSGGKVQAAFTNFINSPRSVAIQGDGKIVVVGTASSADGTLSEFAIARFNPNGTLDATFGTGGKVTTNFVGVMQGGVSNPANAVLIQLDGKILVGGGASECGKCIMNSALARYNSDGSLDSTFGTGGMVDVKAVGAVMALAEDAEGNIFTGDSAAVEFSASGTLQTTITPASVVVSSHGGPIAFQPDGLDVVGETAVGTNRHDLDAQIVRLTQTGAIDPTFNNPPFDYGNEGGTANDSVAATALQSDLGVIAAGGTFAGGTQTFGLARISIDGSLDPSFGAGGVVTTSFPGQSAGAATNAVIVQSDGKIVAVGTGFNNTTGVTSLVLARYLAQ
jgi:uncharacterized delta-60 repeat protein